MFCFKNELLFLPHQDKRKYFAPHLFLINRILLCILGLFQTSAHWQNVEIWHLVTLLCIWDFRCFLSWEMFTSTVAYESHSIITLSLLHLSFSVTCYPASICFFCCSSGLKDFKCLNSRCGQPSIRLTQMITAHTPSLSLSHTHKLSHY